MAPRGRPKKPRNSRMDAAIDHMSSNLGFPEELVRRKMKNLLEVYDGEWFFIEENNYFVLLEAILEELKNTKKEEDNEENSTEGENIEDNPAPDERVEDPDLLPSVGSSSGVVDQSTCNPEIINTSTQAGDTEHVEEQGKKSSEDSEVCENCSEKEIINGTSNTTEGFYVGEGHIGNNAAYSPPPLVISPRPVEANPPRGRLKPCHGWISDGDGEDDDDFINLTPAVGFWGTPSATMDVKEKKRKTRWDVRPEDCM